MEIKPEIPPPQTQGIVEKSELKAKWEQICLPIKMKGMGLRCGAAAAAAAYIASEYACAPAVSAELNAQANKIAFDKWEAACAEPLSSSASPPEPPATLPFTVPASVVQSIAEARKLLPAATNEFLDETPIEPSKDAPSLSHLQHKLTRFVEAAAFERLKGAARGERDAAHFNSNEGSWLFTTPLEHLRLSGAHLCSPRSLSPTQPPLLPSPPFPSSPQARRRCVRA